MPIMQETQDILGYYDESRQERRHSNEGRTFAVALGDLLERQAEPLRRWPVRNREPRMPIGSHKRAIIHERDGGVCRICGTGGHRLTVDHIIPRSAFTADQLGVADRSDNLISACWPCNEGKSNYEHPQVKRMGVVVKCWECLNPGADNWPADERPELPILAYCGLCGINRVPSVSWIL